MKIGTVLVVPACCILAESIFYAQQTKRNDSAQIFNLSRKKERKITSFKKKKKRKFFCLGKIFSTQTSNLILMLPFAICQHELECLQ